MTPVQDNDFMYMGVPSFVEGVSSSVEKPEKGGAQHSTMLGVYEYDYNHDRQSDSSSLMSFQSDGTFTGGTDSLTTGQVPRGKSLLGRISSTSLCRWTVGRVMSLAQVITYAVASVLGAFVTSYKLAQNWESGKVVFLKCLAYNVSSAYTHIARVILSPKTTPSLKETFINPFNCFKAENLDYTKKSQQEVKEEGDILSKMVQSKWKEFRGFENNGLAAEHINNN